MLQGMPLQAEDSVGMQTAARYPIVMDKPAPGASSKGHCWETEAWEWW